MPASQGSREATRESNRRRAGCRRCGASHVHYEQGTATHPTRFEGIVYKVCGGCGYEQATKRPVARPIREEE